MMPDDMMTKQCFVLFSCFFFFWLTLIFLFYWKDEWKLEPAVVTLRPCTDFTDWGFDLNRPYDDFFFPFLFSFRSEIAGPDGVVFFSAPSIMHALYRSMSKYYHVVKNEAKTVQRVCGNCDFDETFVLVIPVRKKPGAKFHWVDSSLKGKLPPQAPRHC